MVVTKQGGSCRSPGDGTERADQGVIGGKPVPGHLACIHDVSQATKYRVGEPMAAQIVPDPLDRVELRAVGRQLQQSDIAGHHQALAAVPAGTIEDHHGTSIGGDLTADLAEMVVMAAILQIGMISAAALPSDGPLVPVGRPLASGFTVRQGCAALSAMQRDCVRAPGCHPQREGEDPAQGKSRAELHVHCAARLGKARPAKDCYRLDRLLCESDCTQDAQPSG